MSPSDNEELLRLSALLTAIDDSLPDPSPLREGLMKAGLALIHEFNLGRRESIEDSYNKLGKPLSEADREYLISREIDPDASDQE